MSKPEATVEMKTEVKSVLFIVFLRMLILNIRAILMRSEVQVLSITVMLFTEEHVRLADQLFLVNVVKWQWLFKLLRL